MSRGTPFADQRQLGVGEYPAAAIEKGWNVVMSTGITSVQFVLGYKLDQAKISSKTEEDYRIKHIAG